MELLLHLYLLPNEAKAVTYPAATDWKRADVGFVQPRPHGDHEPLMRSPWLPSVIRSVSDAGCERLRQTTGRSPSATSRSRRFAPVS